MEIAPELVIRPEHATDWREVDAALDATAAAWAAGDAAAYAACFTEDVAYVSFVGTPYLGRADVRRCHEALFTSFARGTRLHAVVRQVSFPAPDVCVVVSTGDIGRTPPRTADAKTQTQVMVRRVGGWLCASFQNTQHQRVKERVSFLVDRRFRPAVRPAAAAS